MQTVFSVSFFKGRPGGEVRNFLLFSVFMGQWGVGAEKAILFASAMCISVVNCMQQEPRRNLTFWFFCRRAIMAGENRVICSGQTLEDEGHCRESVHRDRR